MSLTFYTISLQDPLSWIEYIKPKFRAARGCIKCSLNDREIPKDFRTFTFKNDRDL